MKVIALDNSTSNVIVINIQDELHDMEIENLEEIVSTILESENINIDNCDWMELKTDVFGNFTTIEIHE